MTKVSLALTAVLVASIAACVTINVYFPEAAAVEAADRIIDKVRGNTSDDATSMTLPDRSADEPALFATVARSLAVLLVSDARAQGAVDFDKPSPEKQALENSLAARFPSLRPFFDSGAIGLTESGLIDIRDRGLIPLKDRNQVLQLVTAQNNDWSALYAEIARLNGHPEWQDEIRRTFATRWVAKADTGWYYRENGVWKQK